MRQRYNLSFRREQQKKERIRRIIIIIICLFVFAALGTLIYFAWNGIDWGALRTSSDDKKVAEEQQLPKTVDITVNSVGEVTCYNAQLTAAKTDDGYDFSKPFENVKEQIDSADLSLFGLETTFGGEPYKGYPTFNSPDELADALKDTGFDVAVTANEHSLDSDAEGVGRTIDTLDKAGLEAAGTKSKASDDSYLLTTVNGISVGIVAYTEETSNNADNRTLDGKAMTEDEAELINSYSTNVDEDMDKVKASISDAKKAGAQVIICYFSWGDSYDTGANEGEKEIAKTLADAGADMIFGTHPQVVQEHETIKTSDNKEVPVFYSLGNFFSGQRYETVGNRSVEQGMIAQVKLTYDTTKKEITTIESGYIPTWTDRFWDNELNSNVYSIIPLVGDLDTNEILEQSDHYSGAKTALENLLEKLGDPLEKATITKGSTQSQSSSSSSSSSDSGDAKKTDTSSDKEKTKKEDTSKKKKTEKKKTEKKKEETKEETTDDTSKETDG